MDVTSTVLSIILVVGICVGLYMSPNPETLFMIVVVVSFVFYGTGRYWRNIEGYLSRP